MLDSERSESSKDSKNLSDSKLTDESNQISIQEMIDNQFDELENWLDEEFDNIKKDCINMYKNFKVNYKNKKKDENKINNNKRKNISNV